jgi:hypothetical protein
LISSALINDIEYKFAVNIEDINNNGVIKIDIVFKVEFESFKRLAIFLAMFIVFHEVFERSSINVMISSFKHVL